jgi:hypothetical protein
MNDSGSKRSLSDLGKRNTDIDTNSEAITGTQSVYGSHMAPGAGAYERLECMSHIMLAIGCRLEYHKRLLSE